MNEIERRSYLDAMGVPVFYLKKPIAHAKRSPVYAIPAESLDGAVISSGVRPAGANSRAGNRQGGDNSHSELAKIRLELLSPAIVKSDKGAAPAKETVKEASVVIAEQVVGSTPVLGKELQASTSSLQFKLSYYVINSRMAIVDEQPYAQNDTPERARLELLRNILTALEVDYSHCDFQAETISWPLEAEMEFDESPDEAAEQMLNGFIAQKHHSHGFQHLLVFAGSLEALLEERQVTMAAGFSMTITSSLSAMLAYPELKRQVWQQLKPLIPTLATP